jgi:hypothetical protein
LGKEIGQLGERDGEEGDGKGEAELKKEKKQSP